MSLHSKSMTELRGTAQAMGVRWTFSDDKLRLIQKIEQKRDDIVPVAEPPAPHLPVDQRFRSKAPAKVSDLQILRKELLLYEERGLRFTVSPDGQTWEMQAGKKTDSGTMRQPPRCIIQCARDLLHG